MWKLNSPVTVIKWAPLSLGLCACTTATWAVTCCPLFVSVDVPESDDTWTVIGDSLLESEFSIGITSITETPELPVWRIIFF